MAGSIVPELADMFGDEIAWEKALTFDVFGDATSYDSSVPIACHLKGNHIIVLDRNGDEQKSTVQAILAGVFGVAIADRYTLPAGYDPLKPAAIQVAKKNDENGPHHEVVMF